MKNNDLLISGDLTIKDITHTLDFNCEVSHAKNSSSAKGQMKIDRTLYDIIYRSFKYFPDIGDRMIDDIFTIDFEIDAKSGKALSIKTAKSDTTPSSYEKGVFDTINKANVNIEKSTP